MARPDLCPGVREAVIAVRAAIDRALASLGLDARVQCLDYLRDVAQAEWRLACMESDLEPDRPDVD